MEQSLKFSLGDIVFFLKKGMIRKGKIEKHNIEKGRYSINTDWGVMKMKEEKLFTSPEDLVEYLLSKLEVKVTVYSYSNLLGFSDKDLKMYHKDYFTRTDNVIFKNYSDLINYANKKGFLPMYRNI